MSFRHQIGGGRGNIDADPQFVDADVTDDVAGNADDDLRLRSTSPAVDVGDNTAVPADTRDLEGEPGFVDIPTAPDTGSGFSPMGLQASAEAAL